MHSNLELISLINSLDLDNVSIDEIRVLLGKLMSNYRINYKLGLSFTVFRGIKYEEKPLHYDDLIYPPVKHSKLNRANIKGEQMFYGTTLKSALFYELAVKPGDKLAISSWVTNPPLLLSNIGYAPANLKALGSDSLEPLFPIKELSDIEKENYEQVSNFLSMKFSEPIKTDNTFKLTNAIAQVLMGSVELHTPFGTFTEFDGLIYPTIRFNANADNIALKKRAVDYGRISLEQVEYVEIMEFANDCYTYKLLDIAYEQKEKLIAWKNLKNTWTIDNGIGDLYFGDDDKAYNSIGEEIEADK